MPRTIKTKKGTKYYEDLGVPCTASETEIKTAYRRLALQHHPDKANRKVGSTPPDPERFAKISRAYAVLGKAESRKIYDHYGELGITVMEKTGSAGLTEFLLNNHLQGWLLLAFLLMVLMILSFPFLVVLKLSGKLSWPWVVVAVPVWLVDLIICVALGGLSVLFYRSSQDHQQHPAETEDAANSISFTPKQVILSSVTVGVLFSLLMASQVMMVLKLDTIVPASFPWAIVLGPYLLVEILHLHTKVVDLIRVKEAWPGDDPVLDLTSHAFAYAVYCKFRWTIPRVLAAFLFVLRADGWINLSWTLILLPAYVTLLLAPVIDLLYDRAYQEAIFLNGGRALPTIAIHAKFVGSLFLAFIAWSFLGLLNFKLVIPESAPSLSWLLVFLPILLAFGVLAGLLTVCLPILWCCFLSSSAEALEDLENQAPPQPAATTGTNGRLSTVNILRYGIGLAPIQPTITSKENA